MSNFKFDAQCEDFANFAFIIFPLGFLLPLFLYDNNVPAQLSLNSIFCRI